MKERTTMMTAGNVFTIGVVSLLVAVVIAWQCIERAFALEKRVQYLESERKSLWNWCDRLQDTDTELKTRIEALERKPPVINVTNVVEKAQKQ